MNEELAKLRKLAEDATNCPLIYGPMAHADGGDPVTDPDGITKLLTESVKRGSGPFWGVYIPTEDAAATVVCHTGNGPTSEANARFFSVAAQNHIVMVDRIAALEALALELANALSVGRNTASRIVDFRSDELRVERNRYCPPGLGSMFAEQERWAQCNLDDAKRDLSAIDAALSSPLLAELRAKEVGR